MANSEMIKTNLPLELSDFSKPPSMFEVFRKELIRDKLALVSLIVFLGVLIFVLIQSAMMDPAEVRRTSLRYRQQPPSETHFLGTDPAGRDMWGLLMMGARNSLAIGFSVSILSAFIGLGLGLISGVYGGNVDNIIMRIVDTWAMLPTMMIMIVLTTVFRANTVVPLIGVLLLFSWTGRTRFIRNLALQQGRMEYVAASKTLGTRNIVIVFREVMPNLTSMLIVNITVNLAGSIGIETALAILGFGLRPDEPSLGTLVAYAMNAEHLLMRQWLWAPAVGLIIIITVSITFVGQAVSRAANATQRRA